jgi:L-iditol 2-dehydrogenase
VTVSGPNRLAVLHAPGDVRTEERPVPRPGPSEVLVEVRAVGVCGSDVHYFEHGRVGSYVVRSPLVLGHEVSGVVVELGERATRHAVGERVALEPGIPCGRCRECRAGRYNLCRYVTFFATPPVDGAFARYVAIHEDFAFPLPPSLSDEAGALIEPLSVALWACWKGEVGAGTEVLVTGAGPIGQLAARTALALGAREVTVTDLDRNRLRLAASGGARTLDVSAEPACVRGLECDVLLECSGASSALADGIAALRPAGRAVCVGMGWSGDVSIPLALVQERELWLTGTFRYANTYPAAISLAASGAVDLDGIVTGHFGLAEVADALRAGRIEAGSVKPVVLPWSERLR